MDTAEIIVSAPGKVILHGEHAVNYGQPAIASSLNLRTYLQLKSTCDGMVTLELPKVKVRKSWQTQQMANLCRQCAGNATEEIVEQIKKIFSRSDTSTNTEGSEVVPMEILDQAVVAFLYMYTVLGKKTGTWPAMYVRVASTLPVGAGLGSSASYNVCLSAALSAKHGLLTGSCSNGKFYSSCEDSDLEKINSLAFNAEKIMHGTPSGIDNSVATFGGAIKFQSGQVTKIKTMPNLRILLTSTGVPRSTKVLVTGVREKYNRLPTVLTGVIESIGHVAESCQQTYAAMETDPQFYEQHFTVLEELVDINQHLLAAIGVSHVTLDKICQVTSKHGVHSKLTGAGGGGCAYSLLSRDAEAGVVNDIRDELEKEGFECWETSVGGQGVTFHKELPKELS